MTGFETGLNMARETLSSLPNAPRKSIEAQGQTLAACGLFNFFKPLLQLWAGRSTAGFAWFVANGVHPATHRYGLGPHLAEELPEHGRRAMRGLGAREINREKTRTGGAWNKQVARIFNSFVQGWILPPG